jgi:hypothetical protein
MTHNQLEQLVTDLETASFVCGSDLSSASARNSRSHYHAAILAAFATLTAERDALRAELDQRWRSMETAPKDGRKVIRIGKSGCVWDVDWDSAQSVWWDHWANPVRPIAWQPLPAAPEAGK